MMGPKPELIAALQASRPTGWDEKALDEHREGTFHNIASDSHRPGYRRRNETVAMMLATNGAVRGLIDGNDRTLFDQIIARAKERWFEKNTRNPRGATLFNVVANGVHSHD